MCVEALSWDKKYLSNVLVFILTFGNNILIQKMSKTKSCQHRTYQISHFALKICIYLFLFFLLNKEKQNKTLTILKHFIYDNKNYIVTNRDNNSTGTRVWLISQANRETPCSRHRTPRTPSARVFRYQFSIPFRYQFSNRSSTSYQFFDQFFEQIEYFLINFRTNRVFRINFRTDRVFRNPIHGDVTDPLKECTEIEKWANKPMHTLNWTAGRHSSWRVDRATVGPLADMPLCGPTGR